MVVFYFVGEIFLPCGGLGFLLILDLFCNGGRLLRFLLGHILQLLHKFQPETVTAAGTYQCFKKRNTGADDGVYRRSHLLQNEIPEDGVLFHRRGGILDIFFDGLTGSQHILRCAGLTVVCLPFAAKLGVQHQFGKQRGDFFIYVWPIRT